MHSFVPGHIYSNYLSRPTFSSVLYAALFGIPLPLCSCGVIPTAMSLRREGASKGSAVSFLISTPQTGVDSIVATYSLMGLPFAVVRPIVALLTALMGGQMVNWFDNDNKSAIANDCNDDGGESDDDNCGCGCGCEKEGKAVTFWGKMKEALEYAFVDMMSDIGKWLVIGLVVAGLITVLVPDSFFAIFADNSILSMLLVLCMAVPMYLCATGSIPIAVALMMKGLTPGAGLVLLMAGPASNLASILVVRKVLGRKTMLIYLASIIAGAIGFGLVIDHLLPREWFVSSLTAAAECCHETTPWWAWLCTIVLALLLFYALVLKKCLHKCHGVSHDNCCCHANKEEGGCCCHEEKKEDSCCCHEEKEDGGCGCHGETSDDDCCCCHGEQHEEEKSITVKVKGMTCNHCRMNAEKAIASVKGVKAVSVDIQSGMAQVTGNAKIDDIRDAVESLGFSLEA